ncbi:BRA0787 family protein [Rhizobium yanglingense]
MTNALPPLHNGHAPITLQELFREALYAFEEWDTELTEPIVTFEGRVIPISLVFEAMRECDDIVPMNIVGAVTERLTKPWEGEGPLDQMSFSTAARVMRVLVRKRLLANGGADIMAVSSRTAERNPPE